MEPVDVKNEETEIRDAGKADSRPVKEVSLTEKVLTLLVVCLLTFLICAGAGILMRNLNITILRIYASYSCYILMGAVALIAMKRTGMKPDIDFRSGKQFLIGLNVAVILSVCIAIIPAKLGVSFVGSHEDFRVLTLVNNLISYFIFVGPVEELVFRVYVQGTLTDMLGRNKWLGVILASSIFGLWHLVNGNIIQVLFTFGIGMVFGFVRYLNRDFKLLGLGFSHGLYDFMNYLVRLFIAA